MNRIYQEMVNDDLFNNDTGFVTSSWPVCLCIDHWDYIEMCASCREELNVQPKTRDGFGNLKETFEQETRLPNCPDTSGSCDLKAVREDCYKAGDYCRDRHKKWGECPPIGDEQLRPGCHYRHPGRPKSPAAPGSS